jgi:hypothetical protein
MRNGPIEKSGVEMTEAIMRRKAFAERALARSRRPVDGDDHSVKFPAW